MKVHGWILFAAALATTPALAKSGLECDTALSTKTVETSSLVLISRDLKKVESTKDLNRAKGSSILNWWKSSQFESASYLSVLKVLARNTAGKGPLFEIIDLRDGSVVGGGNNLGRAYSHYDAKADNNVLNQASDGFDRLLVTVYGDYLVEALNLGTFKMSSSQALKDLLELKDGETTSSVTGVVDFNGTIAFIAVEIKRATGVRNVIVRIYPGDELKLKRLANLEVGPVGRPELFLHGDKDLVLTHRHETQGQSKQALVFNLR
jgi:hypothetical protein